MTNTFVETYKPNKSADKVDEDGNIVVGENIQLIIESTIINVEE